MKKLYTLLAVLFIAAPAFPQLTVTATAVTPTICLGNSTNITASATPLTYTVTSIPNASIPLDGLNILADGGTAIVPLSTGSLDDGRWDNITLPFTFRFYGNTFNSINISTNGWIGMGSTNSTTTGLDVTLPDAAAPNNVIHAITADLTFGGVGNIASLEYFTSGSAPNRVFVINYGNVKFFTGSGTANVQVMLYEGSNIIEIHTDDCDNTAARKSQGVENATGTVAAVATGRNNTFNWTGMPNAYRFTPATINFSWSPSTGLSSTTGGTVTATPTATQVYTVNATNPSNGQTGSTTVTVTVSAASYVMAGTAGGASVCQNIGVVAGGKSYRDVNCNLIASIVPAGGSPVTNSINTCVKVDVNSTKRGTSDLYLARKYDIEPIQNPSTSTANITLYYKQSEFDNFNARALDSGHRSLPTGSTDATGIGNLVLRQFHGTGTAPGNYTGSTQDFTTANAGFSVVWNSTRSWWEVTVPVTGFSGFYITSKKVGTLGISIEYLKGAVTGKATLLSWKVDCTSAQAKMELQRSADGIHFTTITTIIADQARCGQPFDFTDNAPLDNKNYYRIKVTDVDGKFSYSNTTQLTLKNMHFDISLYPSVITTENSMLRINTVEKKQVTVVISDLSGRTLNSQQTYLLAGANQVLLLTDKLTRGTYFVSVLSSGEKAASLKLIKQ